MKTTTSILIILVFSLAGLNAQEQRELAIGQPDAIVDLRTKEGTAIVKTEWRYSDAHIVEADFKKPGPKEPDPLPLYPTGGKLKTHDIHPKAGAADFDDSKWEVLDPTSLEVRRGSGLLSFNWYRLNVTIPEKVGNMSTAGATVVFEIVMDDYSEIWVNGKLNKTFGQSGNGVASGWNARNRVFLTNNAKPGEVFQLAILGTNGPIERSDLNTLKSIAGTRPMVLVNAHGDRWWIPEVNATLSSFTNARRGVVLADWTTAVAPYPDALAGDGIHPNPSGGEIYSAAIREALIALQQPAERLS